MGLPATITLNVGSPAADVIFADAKVLGPKTTFSAESPQGDLLGRRSLIFSQEDKARGTVGTLVRIEVPYFNTEKGAYHPVTPSIHTVINMPSDIPIQHAKDLMEMMRELLTQTTVYEAIAKGTL